MPRLRTLTCAATLTMLAALTAGTFATAAGAATPAQKKAETQLKARVLAVSDMPTGWKSQPIAKAGTSPSCLRDLKKPGKGVERTEVEYASSSSLPALDQVLETGTSAKARYQKFNKAMSSCHQISFTVDGQTIKGTAKPMSFSKVGKSSSAYALTFNYQGTTIGLDIVLFTVGAYVSGISYEDTGSPNVAQLQGFVSTAVAKLQAKST